MTRVPDNHHMMPADDAFDAFGEAITAIDDLLHIEAEDSAPYEAMWRDYDGTIVAKLQLKGPLLQASISKYLEELHLVVACCDVRGIAYSVVEYFDPPDYDCALNERELAAILTGLRLLQHCLEGTEPQFNVRWLSSVRCISSDSGCVWPLSSREIDWFCEQLHVMEASRPRPPASELTGTMVGAARFKRRGV